MVFSKDYSHLLLIPEGKEGAIAIPGSTTNVPAQALSLCRSGSSLTTGDGGTEFASYDRMLFSKDLKTLVAVLPAYGTAVVLPTETESIGEYALAGCKDLASITALGNVQSIDPTAFTDEVKASAVVALPAGEGYEARKAVWEVVGFQHFAEPATPGATTNSDTNEATGLTYTLLDDYTLSVSWQGTDDPEANLEIPASAEINGVPYRVSTIAENAFANRGSLISVKLPSTITTINNGAFAGCANLAAIEFPNTLRTIGERAFEATSLKDLWLPASINSIGSRAFASCSTLERVVALGIPEVATDALAGCTNTSIYIPSGSENTWNPGLPSDNNHLMSYGITLSEEPLTIEAGQEADLLEGGNLQTPDPVEASYSYAAAPLSVDAGTVSAKKAGASDVTAVLSLDNVELTRASRTVEVSPNPDAEANIVQLNSEVALPGVYLSEARDVQISVDAPFAVTFGQDAPYDVAEGKSPSSMEASAKFTNKMDVPVKLAQVECVSQEYSDFLVANDGAAEPMILDQTVFSLYPEDAKGAAIHFGFNPDVNKVAPKDPSAFTIPPGASSSYIFRLNLTNGLADAKIVPEVADAGITTRDLASVMCTFAPPDFYLKDDAGNYYTLADVKSHAVDIAKNKEKSQYYNQYKGYLDNDSTYTCRTFWGNTSYDVRIIGINHDELAEPIAGGPQTAGLTFQFKDLLNETYQMNVAPNTNEGGWGQSQLRARMNPANLPNKDDFIPNGGTDNDEIWDLVPTDLQDSIEIVKKKYQPESGSKASTIITSDDKLFVLSYSEFAEFSQGCPWGDGHWITQEGTQYAYWNGKTHNNDINECLKKGINWWERTMLPNGSVSFLNVNLDGVLSISYNASYFYGVCPCFCL